jgi:membrane protease subunit (stomatin/prohibitin family)
MEKMSQPTEKKAIEAKEFDINLTDPKQKYEQLIKNKEKGEIIDINNSNFHVYLHQVQIQMINDAEDAVPVLDIQISSTQLDQNVTLGQS